MSENDGDMQRDIGKFRRDPLGFVRYAFPWGQAGTALASSTLSHRMSCGGGARSGQLSGTT